MLSFGAHGLETVEGFIPGATHAGFVAVEEAQSAGLGGGFECGSKASGLVDILEFLGDLLLLAIHDEVKGGRLDGPEPVLTPFGGGHLLDEQVLGGQRVPVPVVLRYRRSGGHDHFHLVGFQRYELRDADGRLVVRDHKLGYCLGDRRSVGGERPRFTGNCGRGNPRALEVEQGLSPGFADPYASDLGGQALDVSGLPAGEYVLVNVANPLRALRESAYGDDAASVRFVLARPPAPAGIAFVQVLATCRSEQCPA